MDKSKSFSAFQNLRASRLDSEADFPSCDPACKPGAAQDPSPLLIGLRNVAAIWIVALIAYAVIASLV